MKFLFDLFPIILFFAAYKLYDIYVATGVAIAAALVQTGLFWLKHRRFENMHLVTLGLLIVFVVYWLTKESGAWDVGTREVVYMAIGAALYAIFSYLFNGTVFVVPSVSQVSLRPAIAIPMFFGYAFGPAVGFF